MRGRERRAAVAAVVAAAVAGCAVNPAPREWLLRPADAQRRASGSPIELRCGKAVCGRGELIAVASDHLLVLGDAGVERISLAAVTKATLAAYRTREDALAAWGTLGALSAASHGWFLVFTLPLLWIPGAIGAPAEESRNGLIRFPKQPWSAFGPFARFPQGLPPRLDPASLRGFTPQDEMRAREDPTSAPPAPAPPPRP